MTSSPEPSEAPLSASGAEQDDAEAERAATTPEHTDASVAGLSGGLLRAVAALALLATVIARGLAPALPGSAAGISGWIRASGTTAMLLSQLLVVSGALVVFRLLIRTLRKSELGVFYRLLAVPLGAAALTIIMAAAEGPTRPVMALGLAVVTATVAIAATFPTLSTPRTRAAGFVLGAVGVGSFVHVLSRVLAIRASEQALASLFTMSQSVATLSFVLDVASIVLVAVWLGARNRSRAAVIAVVLVGVSSAVAWGAMRGSSYDASLWEVLASRSLAELTRHPAPLVLAPLQYSVEVLALLTAGVALVVPKRNLPIQALVALALLARVSTDIPLCALCLVMAALLGPLASLAQREETAKTTNSAPGRTSEQAAEEPTPQEAASEEPAPAD